MGFSREQIVREFAGIFERFGFDQRGEVPVEQSESKNVEYRPPPH